MTNQQILGSLSAVLMAVSALSVTPAPTPPTPSDARVSTTLTVPAQSEEAVSTAPDSLDVAQVSESPPDPRFVTPKVLDPRFVTPLATLSEPPAGLVVPKAVVAAKPSGHWETQRYGFRGRLSQQVWVSNQPAKQQPVYQYTNSGGCANGSCGRGGIF